MSELRLGDVIDDYCSRCRMITNHAIVSMVGGGPAKMRCRTCYNEHDYRHAQIPAKKDTKKGALFREVLSSIDPSAQAPEAAPPPKDRRKKPGRQ
jgi:hypothetical protein